MFDYLQKFNSLPKDLRQKVSGSKAVATIDQLEKKYGVELAILVMKVMAKVVSFDDLPRILGRDFGLDDQKARDLLGELRQKIFKEIEDYLGIKQQLEESKSEISSDTSSKLAPAKAMGSNFFFSPEDEKEIRELSEKIGDLQNRATSGELATEKIKEITAKMNINFSSQQLSERFGQILGTYFRGIRGKVEVRESLKKEIGQGGLGLNDFEIDKILLETDKLRSQREREKRSIPTKINLPEDELKKEDIGSELKKAGVRDLDYDFKKLKKKSAKDVGLKKIDTEHQLAPPPPALKSEILKEEIKPTPAEDKKEIKKEIKRKELSTDPVIPQQAVPQAVKTEKVEIKAPLEEPSQAEKQKDQEVVKKVESRPRQAALGSKKRMDDIRHVPRAMNPIDELKYMDLVSFRRLGQAPTDITSRIKEKISLLEEEQYSKRLEGIKAWRESLVNKLYLQIGEQGISENKAVDAIIKEMQLSGQDCLTEEEFVAVMDLNKELRF